MHNVHAHAVRTGKSIEVTIAGQLADSCHTARITDFYPGGSRTYLVDPGAAQVFIDEHVKPGSNVCLYVLTPWMATIVIPDKDHRKVEVFINNREVLEVPVVERTSQFIVVALTGTKQGCSVIPKDAPYLAIYSKVYGPASYEECVKWVAANCGSI